MSRKRLGTGQVIDLDNDEVIGKVDYMIQPTGRRVDTFGSGGSFIPADSVIFAPKRGKRKFYQRFQAGGTFRLILETDEELQFQFIGYDEHQGLYHIRPMSALSL